jgi:hypothetical protein
MPLPLADPGRVGVNAGYSHIGWRRQSDARAIVKEESRVIVDHDATVRKSGTSCTHCPSPSASTSELGMHIDHLVVTSLDWCNLYRGSNLDVAGKG